MKVLACFTYAVFVVFCVVCVMISPRNSNSFAVPNEVAEDIDQLVEETMVSPSGESTVVRSPFVDMFGETLYKWASNGSHSEVHIVSTEDQLKEQPVIALYYSASWCGPCRQFTPLLVEFYNHVKKKGKRFEVVWLSRDNTADEFFAYYQQMPWLAVPADKVQECLELTAQKYQLNGIPHLVLLDGFDASIITLDGRVKVVEDKYGLEFPWRRRTLLNLLPRPVRNAVKSKVEKAKTKVTHTIQGILQGLMPSTLLRKLLNRI